MCRRQSARLHSRNEEKNIKNSCKINMNCVWVKMLDLLIQFQCALGIFACFCLFHFSSIHHTPPSLSLSLVSPIFHVGSTSTIRQIYPIRMQCVERFESLVLKVQRKKSYQYTAFFPFELLTQATYYLHRVVYYIYNAI